MNFTYVTTCELGFNQIEGDYSELSYKSESDGMSYLLTFTNTFSMNAKITLLIQQTSYP